MESATHERPLSRFRVGLAVGVALGIAAGLVNAFYVWQLEGLSLVSEDLGLPLEMRAARGPWSRTSVFLTSVLAHAALGAVLGAVLGAWRTLRLRPDAERRVLHEALRDGSTLLFLCAALYLVASGIPAVIWRGGGSALAVVLAAGLLAGWAISRLAAWLLAAGLERLLRGPRVAAVIGRIRWRPLGGIAAAALVLFALVPPLLAGLPPGPAPTLKPAPAGAPNVILLVLDTTRADRLSAYGHSRPTTPEIDRIASQGILYEQAVSAGVWTLPGHAGIFTGAPSSVHGANGRRLFLDPSVTTLAEVLSRNGYATAGFSNNPWVARATGMTRGFRHFEDHWRAQAVEPIRLLQKGWEALQILWRNVETVGGAEYTLARTRTWIEDVRAGSDNETPTPFFAFVNLMEAHEPRTYRPGHTDLFRKPGQTPSRLQQVWHEAVTAATRGQGLSGEQLRLLRVLYDGELRFADHQIGAFVRDLERRGVLDGTLLVITSDHGEAIGDHRRMNHLQSVYEELVRVPLILRHPRLPAGLRVPTRVQTFDLFRTIVQFVGIAEPLPEDARLSQDLLDLTLLAGRAAPRPIVAEEEPSEWGIRLERSLRGDDADTANLSRRYKAYYEGDLKYIWRGDEKRELYDLAKDPRERRNLARRRPADVERLARALAAWVETLPANRIDSGATPHEVEFDPETERALRALGYAE